ncbi:MAG TPA: helix-turn-helix domain-containing protein [Rhizomicrobium sp.]|jgi:transcriptional regulator with XRE-family HTH domain|nr:helix-turn-helix domain-containing protein [Rhizomicrobium sp.]
MTVVQCRMARAGLGIGVRDVAKLARVSPSTVARFEAGEELLPRTVETIQRALEGQGVEFTNGDPPGLKLRALVRKKSITQQRRKKK